MSNKHNPDDCPFQEDIEKIKVKVSQEEWFDNKDLYSLFLKLSSQTELLSEKLDQTIMVVKKYNGLREDFMKIEQRLNRIEVEKNSAVEIKDRIVKWGGWVVAILTFTLAVMKYFGGG